MIDEFIRALERAQAHAYPGREAAERDHVLRELWHLLQQQPTARARALAAGALLGVYS